MSYTSMPDTPVAGTLLAMTAASLERSDLPDREIMLARLAALAAVDAPPISYTLNTSAAADSGLTLEDAQGILVAVAPSSARRGRVGRRRHYRGPGPGDCPRARCRGGRA